MPHPAKRFEQILQEIHPVIAGMDADAFQQTSRALQDAPRVFLAGAGRSGLLMKMFAMRLMQCGLSVYVAGESTTPAIGKGDLLLITSGSGGTATMRMLAEKAMQAGAHLLLLTYTPASPLAEMAKHVLFLPIPTAPERPGGVGGGQLLGTLFDQAVQFTTTLLVEAIAEARGESNASLQARHANLE